ncbi:MAG TPA: tripartite tricarboxylate transporter substrate binding protein BugD [Casimicrobiaceae bacterium]|nr:tripartite tricarboxylate transporter substrate binding protein BugD [Casimicrobiaceae bacterium]
MFFKALVAALALSTAASDSRAQDYPNKPVTIVIPFAAGGPTDVVARVLAQSMSKSLGQSVLVDNTLGAGGTIAATKVARSRPDGYTVFLHHNGMATSPALYRKLEFNPLTDFEYIGLVADVPMTLVARKDFPPKDFKELVAYLRANKDKVSVANAGLGAVSHLCGMLFMSAINLELTTIPYKGTAPAMNDLMGGQVDLLCDQTTQTTSPIKAERIKVYGVTSKARLDTLPNVPTLAEQGLAGFEVVVWHGLYAPKGTPMPIVEKMSAALQAALKDPAVVTKFAELSAFPVPPDQATPDALRAHLKKEIDKYGPIIKKAGIYAD